VGNLPQISESLGPQIPFTYAADERICESPNLPEGDGTNPRRMCPPAALAQMANPELGLGSCDQRSLSAISRSMTSAGTTSSLALTARRYQQSIPLVLDLAKSVHRSEIRSSVTQRDEVTLVVLNSDHSPVAVR